MALLTSHAVAADPRVFDRATSAARPRRPRVSISSRAPVEVRGLVGVFGDVLVAASGPDSPPRRRPCALLEPPPPAVELRRRLVDDTCAGPPSPSSGCGLPAQSRRVGRDDDDPARADSFIGPSRAGRARAAETGGPSRRRRSRSAPAPQCRSRRVFTRSPAHEVGHQIASAPRPGRSGATTYGPSSLNGAELFLPDDG